jgi:predicted phage terminase large subunit-like protein
MKVKWSKYIPHKPWPKQLAFLSLPNEEAFYGGAAGGGKSDALLMGALQYVDDPLYKGVIIRRTYADMLLPGSILDRAKTWLYPFIKTGEVKYRPGQNHSFTFPSGATLVCGYMENAGDEERYQGSDYSYVAYDELGHFTEEQYIYLFSRMRNAKDCNSPIRMRGAGNPGGIGLRWIKKRFGIKKDPVSGLWIGTNKDAPFIPANRYDNPAINAEDYGRMLDKLGKVERERLKEGDWDVNEDALFYKEWFDNCRYRVKHDQFYHIFRKDGMKVVNKNDLFIFCTVDCAASVKTGVKNKSYSKTRPQASHSVIATWGVTPDYDLLWLDNWRFQVTIPELCNRIKANAKLWKPLYTIIEKNGPGEGVYQMSEKAGLPVKPINTTLDKIKNSIAAQLRAERGQIFLPEWANWIPELEDELYTWVGDPNELDDQIDVLSNAANETMLLAMGYEKESILRQGLQRAVPYASGGSANNPYWGRRKSVWGNGDRRGGTGMLRMR